MRKTISNKIRKKLFNENKQCCCCGANDQLEIDHIIPVKMRGKSDINNLQVLCRECNQLKTNREDDGLKDGRYCKYQIAYLIEKIKKKKSGHFYIAPLEYYILQLNNAIIHSNRILAFRNTQLNKI